MSTSKHRVLVIGVGSIGERNLRCFQNTGRVELGIAEVLPERAQAVAERYGIERVYDDYTDAIADGFDAAVVAAPANLHIPVASVLSEAGIHLLIEKPLSVSPAGIAELRETIQRKQLVAGIGYTFRSDPALADAREAIAAGRLGRPLHIVGIAGQDFAANRPAYREIYFNDHATGGGAIQDALTHMINAAEWLVGPIDRLACDAAHRHLEGVTVEDTVNVISRHGSVMGSFSLNMYQGAGTFWFSVTGERATAEIDLIHSRWRWKGQQEHEWNEHDFGPVERDKKHVWQANRFLDAVEGTGEVTCSFEEGWQTLQVNRAALEAWRSTAWVQVETVP